MQTADHKKGKYKHSLKFVESFAGKNVLVTGAGGAIGKKVCEKLLKAGVNKLVMYVKARDMQAASKINQAVNSKGGSNKFIVEVVDLKEPTRIEHRFANTMK